MGSSSTALPPTPRTDDRRGARSLTLAGTSLVAVSFGLARYGYGLFAPQFQTALHLSLSTIGTISSLSYVGYGLGLLACPWLIRRFGARCPVLAAAAVVSAGIFVIASAWAASVLTIGVVIAGVGVGLAWPPFSQLAADHVDETRRPRVVSTISTGTSFGLILAVPLALIAGQAWRTVWVAFGVLAVVTLALVIRTVPRDARDRGAPVARDRGVGGPRGLGWLAGYSTIYGAIGATFFTFAIELAQAAHHSHSASVLLWAIVGASGIAAVRTGDTIDRLGLRNVVCLLLLGTTAALLCIGLAGTSLIALAIGVALFGPFYMAGAAIVPRWSEQTDPTSPARAHTIATGASAVGSIAGAAAAGALGSTAGLPAVFVATATLTALTAMTLPRLALPATTPTG
jgi:predicted MFS family arabinose efflux permease